MKIAVDADLIGRNRSGNETFLKGLIGGLQRQEGIEQILIGGNPSEVSRLVSKGVIAKPAPEGVVGELGFGWRASQAGADVALTTYNAALGFRGKLSVCIVHDVSYRRMPETFPRLLRLRIAASVKRTIRAAGLIVTVSEFSRRELLDVYPELPEERTAVVYNAPSAELGPVTAAETARVREKYCLPAQFVLCVGNLQPRKNLVRLSEAAQLVGIPLAVAGQSAWLTSEVLRQSNAPVNLLGFVPTEDLRALYGACTVFAYPSLYEGYGLPVIEAMACGAPVVTSNGSALLEVASDAAELVEPTSVESIAQALLRVVASEGRAAELRAAGFERARDFNWDVSAARFLSAIKERL